MKGLPFYIRKLAAGSLAMSLEKASQNMVGLILLPIFAIFLSPEDFGILSMFSLVVTALGLLYNPGTVSSAVRLYFDTNDPQRQREIFASTHLFFLLLPIPFTLALWFFGDRLFGLVFNEFKFWPFGFLGVMLAFFSQPKRIWAEYMIVKYKVVSMAISTFIAFISGSAVSIACIVWLDMGVMGRVIGMYVAPVILFGIAMVTLRKYAGGTARASTMVEVVKFGLPLTGAIWAYSILQYTGSYLLERYMSLTDVGIYNIAYRLAGIPMFITLGFRQMWNPVFYENMQSENYPVIRRLMSLFILVFSLLCGITMLFAKEVVLLLFDERYLPAIPVINWIVLGVFPARTFAPLERIFGICKTVWAHLMDCHGFRFGECSTQHPADSTLWCERGCLLIDCCLCRILWRRHSFLVPHVCQGGAFQSPFYDRTLFCPGYTFY
jgi:O-antigen/teichoic acid export membrane protein